MVGSSGKKARGKHRLDKFYHLAKEQGYRSRAAFKLLQLNKKYGFLNDARAVLDLCAAPGGWLQVCSKHMPISARILGVDLEPIKPVRGAKTIVDDITTQRCRERLRKESEGSLFDIVLHDGAPNVGGAFATEMYSQSALVLDACKLACEFLRPGGSFVTKVFRSRDYTALLYAFRELFGRVDATKPQASRNTSAEIFVVCSAFKAPSKLDPRLLDHRVLFQDMEEPAKAMGPDALLKKIGKKHRHRDGYETNTSIMHSSTSAADFILTSDPMSLLANTSLFILEGPESVPKTADQGQCEIDKVVWDPSQRATFVREHPSTTAEVCALCADLRVLGRSEFKQLLRWRLKVRGSLLKAEAEAAPKHSGAEAEMEAEGSEKEKDPEAELLAEMDHLREKAAHEFKVGRKKARELKRKARLRLAASAATAGIGEEVQAEEDALFDLSAVRGRSMLQAIGDAPALDEQQVEDIVDAPNSDDELVNATARGSESGDDEEALEYEAMVEEYLDNAYQSYLQRQLARGANQKEKVKRHRLADTGEDVASGADLDGLPEAKALAEEEADSEDEAGGGLIVELDEEQAGRRSSGAALARQWFAQEAFQDEDLASNSSSDDEPGSTPEKLRKEGDEASNDVDAYSMGEPDSTEPGSGNTQAKHAAQGAGIGVDATRPMSTTGKDALARDKRTLKVPGKARDLGYAGASKSAPDSLKRLRDGRNAAAAGAVTGNVASAVLTTDGTDERERRCMHAELRSGASEAAQRTAGRTAPQVTSDANDSASSDDDSDEGGGVGRTRTNVVSTSSHRGADSGDLEVVPQATGGDGDSTDTDAEFEAMEDSAKAEIRAMARKWLGGRKMQLSILDAGYNRYTFNDEGLPRWFREDEAKHMQPGKLVEQAEIAAEREAMRPVDARPLRKVAEAHARKRRRVLQRLAKARSNAEAIVENEDMSAVSKRREIGKLYAKAKAVGRSKGGAKNGDKKLSRSARRKARRKGPPLDRRMIADKRRKGGGKEKGRSKGRR